MSECFAPTGRGPMKTQGFERRFSQNLAPVSLVKPQNLYFAYISNLFSKPYFGVKEKCVNRPFNIHHL
ncbi:hypothetical protein ED562_11005 [Microcystis aeruginosa FACHB-524]|uniref:Uncharacterized protein n=1 Tax=Microcystis aeruginosa DA14 TaxID=1987506 RepID=A0A3E0MGL6_MICAE|nr:MAG: hypothetical protein DWQ56_06615 [Microcystis aeruginosa DA14]ROI03998.1 hypothetical protein ED562_11005 [Microcystis aeruginosa FACHB-524]